MVELAHGLSDPFAATLRIGIIPTVGPYLLPEIAPALRKRDPKLQFVWVEEKTSVLAQRLERAELDAAIAALDADELGDLPHAVLGRDPFVLAAPTAIRSRKAKAACVPISSRVSTCCCWMTVIAFATRRCRSAPPAAPKSRTIAPPVSRRWCRWQPMAAV